LFDYEEEKIASSTSRVRGIDTISIEYHSSRWNYKRIERENTD